MAAGGESSMAATEAEMKLECFDFAFNSERFSDRLLRIEVVASDDVAEGFLPECTRHLKDKGDKRQRIDSSQTMADTPVLRVKTLHINSAILAARSSSFLKLFSNGMKESDQTQPTIRISDSEENAFMELLSFMYSGTMTTTESTLLLDILMAADKFEVLSCVRCCSQLLISLPMTTESALLYLEHRCSISTTPEVQRVIGAAKQFLAKKYRNFEKSCIELEKFPLAGIEAIFSSSDLLVSFEDRIYLFLRMWAFDRYPESDERRKILSSRLLPLVRFSHMTGSTLQKIITGTDADPDIDHELVIKHISEVLLHKGYPAQFGGAHAAEAETAERAYLFKTVKVVAFDQPRRQVIVYWDLTCHDCSRLVSTRGMISSIFSHQFHLAGQQCRLVAMCKMDEQNKLHRFGLSLVLLPKDSCITVDYEFALRTGLSGKFVSYFNSKLTFTGDPEHGVLPQSLLRVDDSLFINDVLHLRADITIVEQPVLQT